MGRGRDCAYITGCEKGGCRNRQPPFLGIHCMRFLLMPHAFFFLPMTAAAIAAPSSRVSHRVRPLSPVCGVWGSLAITVSASVISSAPSASP